MHLSVLEPGSPRSGLWEGSFLSEACRYPPSQCVLMWYHSHHGTLTFMNSPNPTDLLKALSLNTITSKVKASTYRFWGQEGRHNSVLSIVVSQNL